MRLFVAIDITDSIKKKLCSLQESISQQCRLKRFDVKWVSPEQMHLTLKFLGEVKDPDISEVCRIVETVTAKKSSFELEFETVGSFGGKRASVVWVGVGAGGDELKDLQKDLESKFVSNGWSGDSKGFSGHLTLCRVKSNRAGYELKRTCDSYKNFKADNVFVDSVAIYSSQLTSDGPIYSLVSRYKLQ